MEGEKAEASSTTPGEEIVTKRLLCVQTWKKLHQEKCCIGYNSIFNRIPHFIGSEKAANLLAETEEFKKANNIKVSIGRSQDPVKIHVLSAGKTLYLPPPNESSALCTKIINCPSDADEDTKKKIIKTSTLKENRQEINLEDNLKLDMIVIGSVVVSRDGYRLGRGNGFVDLDIGLLIHTGAITPETLIVTIVHDNQVVDSLPTHLFKKHDTPVDIIATPTEIIRVSKRLARPVGLTWEILSERRLKIVPVLQKIKENEEKAGKIITLKSEDTDVETNARQQRPRQRGRFYRYGGGNRKRSTNNTSNEENKENNNERQRFRGRYRHYNSRRRRATTKSEGEQSSADNKENTSQHRGGGGAAYNRGKRRQRPGNRGFSVKVSNISQGTRIRDLKAELRKRECIPVHISWKGAYGRCVLHFPKRKGTEKEEEIEKVLKSLNDLSLEVQAGDKTKTVNLAVELLKYDNENKKVEIEEVNTTSA
ncbi:methenyltetrahydrofolate synthase domain-containing protein [Condylostylus longicornis]|uniref:methenyltetrahydrofolate synthase domain-containing protein n=1 Tax=Condylostylus longicornis TaxID=2530218 RepID=UPI00244DD9BF|nr:methenyltetrahydrofolate synthase domain-containing protein [Condylostylus longicornis]